jgi:hypothetical protein
MKYWSRCWCARGWLIQSEPYLGLGKHCGICEEQRREIKLLQNSIPFQLTSEITCHTCASTFSSLSLIHTYTETVLLFEDHHTFILNITSSVSLNKLVGAHGGEYEDAVIWVVAPCSLEEVYRRGAYGPQPPDDGGSNHLCNVGKLLPDYTAQHPRRQSSSSYYKHCYVLSFSGL